MKRDRNLHPLSWDHHAALTAVVLVRRQLDSKPGREVLSRIAAEFVAFHEAALVPHFRHEEEWLLPAYVRQAGEEDPLVLQVLQDHVAIHGLIAGLRRPPDDPAECVSALRRLADRLEAHVRLEERQLFPRVEAALGPETLADIGARLYDAKLPQVVIPAGDGKPVSVGPDSASLEVDLD